jgi:hypothetical protein
MIADRLIHMPPHAELVRMAMDSDMPEWEYTARMMEEMRGLAVADIEPMAAELERCIAMEANR